MPTISLKYILAFLTICLPQVEHIKRDSLTCYFCRISAQVPKRLK